VSLIYSTKKMKCSSMMVLTLAVILVMFCSKCEARKRKAGGVCGLTCYREVMMREDILIILFLQVEEV
jgi:hypothetical protein